MKPFLIMALLVSILVACNKPHPTNPNPPQPQPENPALIYTYFNNREIKFGDYFGTDLDKNGIGDFAIGTLLVGDPLVQKDYRQYLLQTERYTYLPMNNEEQTPMLNRGDSVKVSGFAGYTWHDLAYIVMAQKVIGYTETHWEGNWKVASHRYLPIRILTGARNYYGWVELSFSTHDEKVILHRAAISRQPDTGVRTD